VINFIIIVVVGLAVLVPVSVLYGKSLAKKKQAEANVKRMDKNEKIAATAFVNSPFSRMRKK